MSKKIEIGRTLMSLVNEMSEAEAKGRLTAILYGMSGEWVSKSMAILLSGGKKNFEKIEREVQQLDRTDGKNASYRYKATDVMLRACVN